MKKIACNIATFLVALVVLPFFSSAGAASLEEDLVGKTCRAKITGITSGALRMEFRKGASGKLEVTYGVATQDPAAYRQALSSAVDEKMKPINVGADSLAVDDDKRTVTFRNLLGTVYMVTFAPNLSDVTGKIDARARGGTFGVATIETGGCNFGNLTAEKQ